MNNILQLVIRGKTRDYSWTEVVQLLNVAKNQPATLIAIAQQVIQQNPKQVVTYHLIFDALHKTQNFDLLAKYANQAISLFDNDPQSYYALAIACRHLHRPTEALKALEEATSLMPQKVAWRLLLGSVYKEQNKLANALAEFEQCIALDNKNIAAYWLRSDLQKKLNNLDLTYLKNVLTQESQFFTTEHKSYAAYTLYRHFEEQACFDEAFKYLEIGAKYKRDTQSFDIKKEIVEHQRIAEVFSKKLLSPMLNVADITIDNSVTEKDKNNAIFICGLPRSGTTLIEQILSAHSNVTAGGELFELAKATQIVTHKKQPSLSFPLWAEKLIEEDWQEIGSLYLSLTEPLHRSTYLTDKMPLNYKAIGIIAMALPKAKIIHCQRDPIDVLFGCYKQLLGDGNAFSNQLDEMAEMIIAHHHLMQHWKSIIPNNIYTVTYEKLVTSQEHESKKLFSHIGLPWQDAFLAFYNNTHSVHTVSNLQIRQPITQSNVGNWLKYEKHLNLYRQRFIDEGLYNIYNY